MAWTSGNNQPAERTPGEEFTHARRTGPPLVIYAVGSPLCARNSQFSAKHATSSNCGNWKFDWPRIAVYSILR